MMNKGTLIAKVAEKAHLSKKVAGEVLDAILEVIKEALAHGQKVQLIGFGTFEVRERAERKGRNPQTGKEIVIPAKKVPVFRAGEALRKAVQAK